MNVIPAGAIYTVANALSAGVPFLLLPVLTRALSPSEYGVVVAFFLLVNVSTAFAGLNVHSAVAVKWFTRNEFDYPRLVGSALTLALVSTGACALVLLAAGFFWHDRLGLPIALWPFAAIAAGAGVVAAVRTSIWQNEQKPLAASAMQVGGALLNMALSLVAVLMLALGALGRIGASLAASVAIAAVAVGLLVGRDGIRLAWDRAEVRRLLRYGLPLVPHTLAGVVLASTDRFVVSAKLGADALGIYGAAAQLGMFMIVLGDAASKALSPWMYAQLAKRSGWGRLRVVATTYLLIPVWLGAAVLLWVALLALGPFLLGPKFQEATHLSLWFLLGGALTASYVNIAGLFFFTLRSEWLSLATMSTAAITLVIAPLLTAELGLRGAAIAYLIAQAAQLAFSWLLSLRVQPMPWDRPALALLALRHSRGRR